MIVPAELDRPSRAISWRGSYRTAITACATLVLLAVTCPRTVEAQTTACRQEADLHVCRAEGFGAVLNQDIAQARDEALIDARRRAVEQAAGVRVDAKTIVQNQLLFDQLVRTETQGLIQADRVLEEGPTGDGRYRVRIEAWVKAGDVTERLQSLVSDLSLVVLLPEENMSQSRTQPTVEGEVVSRLVDAGYRVLDPAQVQRVRVSVHRDHSDRSIVITRIGPS